MQKALCIIAQRNKDSWGLNEEQLKEQPVVIAKRLRLAMRHISQALSKSKKPAWVLQIFEEEQRQQQQAVEAEAEQEQPIEPQQEQAIEEQEAATDLEAESWPFWGWDVEMRHAWRAKTAGGEGRHSCKEISNNIVKPPGAQPHSPMLAAVPDGHRYALSSLTVEIFDLLAASQEQEAAAKKSSELFFSAEHKTSGLMVTIKLRTDRSTLVVIMHGTQQVCQAPLTAFDSVEAAVGFMKVLIAKKQSQNNIIELHICSEF